MIYEHLCSKCGKKYTLNPYPVVGFHRYRDMRSMRFRCPYCLQYQEYKGRR